MHRREVSTVRVTCCILSDRSKDCGSPYKPLQIIHNSFQTRHNLSNHVPYTDARHLQAHVFFFLIGTAVMQHDSSSLKDFIKENERVRHDLLRTRRTQCERIARRSFIG